MARALPKEEEAFEPETPDFTIVTGLSGAGRSEVANALEDLGYFVVDNLPPSLMPKMVELAVVPGQEIKHIALVVDSIAVITSGVSGDGALGVALSTNVTLIFRSASVSSIFCFTASGASPGRMRQFTLARAVCGSALLA